MISSSRVLFGSGLIGSGLVAALTIVTLPNGLANAQADSPCYWRDSNGQVIDLTGLCNLEGQPSIAPAPPTTPNQTQQTEPDSTLRPQGQVYAQPNYDGPICIYLGRVNGSANVELAFGEATARIAIAEGSLDRVQAVSANISTGGLKDTRIIIRADRRLTPRIASENCTGDDVLVTGIEFPTPEPATPPTAAPPAEPENDGGSPPPPPPPPAGGRLPSLPR